MIVKDVHDFNLTFDQRSSLETPDVACFYGYFWLT